MMPALSMGELRGEMRYDEPLSRHTSWRVGGPARRFYQPADSADLVTFLAGLEPDEPLLWLGLGSNLLVRDAGFAGTVVAIQGRLNALTLQAPGIIRAEAGVACAKVARFAARAGLRGAEFLAGIPGTLGGALAMNAGAFGGEVWQKVLKVETVDRSGRFRERTARDYAVGYRQVTGPEGEWFIAGCLQLEAGDVEAAQVKIRRLLERRAATQPTRQQSCGSVFRNPPGNHAARLIEAAGLKGYAIGGARVSDKHANFIVNTGNASASDIETLIEYVQDEVQRTSGVRLITEVHRVGEAF
jgi:UDP-N-acetylmuramate dehydrogenase